MDLSDSDLNEVARTVLAEAGNQGDAGMAGVASVIRNRLVSGQYGKSASVIVHSPGEFSSWDLPRSNPNNPMNYGNNNADLQHVKDIVRGVWSGSIPDNTGGSVNYLNPSLVRQMPEWAKGQPTAVIGAHNFYAPNGSVMAFNEPSQSDIDETASAFGIKSGQTSVNPVSSFSANISNDDLAATAKSLGITLKSGASPNTTALPQQTDTGISSAAPGKIPQVGEGPTIPTQQEAALAQSRGLPMQAVGAIPVAGPAINAATAAISAAGKPGGSWYDRFIAQLNSQRTADQYFSERFPVASTLAQFAGSGAGFGGLGATGIGRTILGMAPNLPWGTRVYQGAIGGGTLGALDAALRGENPLTGAEVGTAGGVVGPTLAEGARAGTGLAANYLFPPPGPLSGVPRTGINMLTGALEGETPASLAMARARMGPAGFFGDINSATTDITGALADTPGTKAVIRGAYNARDVAQAQRIDQALTDAMGPNFNILDYQQFLKESRAAAADPLYEQFRTMQVQPTNAIKALIPRLDAAGAFDQAEKLAAIDGKSVNRNFFTPGAQKSYPTTETWDYVKRALDSKIDTAYAGGDKTTASKLINLKNNLIDEIGKTPAGQVWNQARSEFADRSALLDQIQAGRDTFIGGRSGTTPDEMAEELKGLSGPELMARIYGARTAAADAMGDTTRGDTTLRNKLLSPNNQQKLRMLLQNDPASDKLISSLQSEKYLSDQSQNVVGGSQTTPKAARLAMFAPTQVRPFSLTEPTTFLPPSLRPENVLQSLLNQNASKTPSALAPLMVTPNGPKLDDLIAAIRAEQSRQATVGRLTGLPSRILGGAISGPGQQAYRERSQ